MTPASFVACYATAVKSQADHNTRSAIAQCVEAINLCLTPDTVRDETRLAMLRVTVSEAIRALLAQPYQGKGRGIGASTPSAYRPNWADVARGTKEGDGVLAWKDRLLVLFDGGRIETDEMLAWAEAIQNSIIHNHVVLHIIQELVADDAIDRARVVAATCLRPVPSLHGDSSYQGYRVLLCHYAGQGDVTEFFGVWPHCAAGRERNEINACKSQLVMAVSVRQGWEAAVTLCNRDRRLGKNYHAMALKALVEAGAYETLRQLFYKREDLLAEHTRLSLLVRAYATAARQGQQNVGEFENLFERVSVLDPKIKAGAVRLRDSLFCELGRNPPDMAWRKRCNAGTKNPALRWKLDRSYVSLKDTSAAPQNLLTPPLSRGEKEQP